LPGKAASLGAQTISKYPELKIMSTTFAKTVNTTSSWISFIKPAPAARLRLFCFPYAGGGAMIFRKWADAFPSTVEVTALRLPGREGGLGDNAFAGLGLV